MWNMTLEAKRQIEQAHILPIRETDEEWASDLEVAAREGEDILSDLKDQIREVKDQLLKKLPERFHPYVHNESLNTMDLPKDVRKDYICWVVEQQMIFEQLMEKAYENKQAAVPFLPEETQVVFKQSLHDAIVQHVKRGDGCLHLQLRTGGFSTISTTVLTFEDLYEEVGECPLIEGQYYIYDELIKTTRGFALRVLFDCPELEWTIEAINISAVNYYEVQVEDVDTWSQFVSQLQEDFIYSLVTPQVITQIQAFSATAPFLQFEQGELVEKADGFYYELNGETILIAENAFALKDTIFCNTYVDPYAHFSEPVPADELVQAALSNDLAYQVRAWNTLYAHSTAYVAEINEILSQIVVTEANEMMISIYVNHFFREGKLTANIVEKYKHYIDEL
ncbi:DUF4085 family protein [Solibacillus sp. FSL H8-0538]|uniref:DUF4085 family protein n=1 Tax=Solibacillus sp. FSL H8-0538 TaxID=2921400 RepID=UPI0030F6CFA9